MKKIDNYLDTLYLVEEANLIQEGLGDVIKNFNINKAKQIFSVLKTGDIKKFKSIADSFGFNRINPKKMDAFAKTKITDYTESKDLAKRVLKNSVPGVSKKMLEAVSSAIATASALPKKKGVVPKSPLKRTKEIVKQVVIRSRKWQDDYMDTEASDKGKRIPPESLPDFAVAIAVVFTITALLGLSIWVVHYVITSLITLFWLALILAAAGSVAWVAIILKTWFGGKK